MFGISRFNFKPELIENRRGPAYQTDLSLCITILITNPGRTIIYHHLFVRLDISYQYYYIFW